MPVWELTGPQRTRATLSRVSTPRSLPPAPGVRRSRIVTPGGSFAGLTAGPRRHPRGFVLLIPGFTGSKEDFAPLLPLLAAAGWLVAAYDQRGQFETPGADDDTYALPELAADARSVAEVVAPRGADRHVVGHSFGGLVAREAVLADPASWHSLVLLCSGPGRFDRDDMTRPLKALVRLLDSAPLSTVHEAMRAHDRRRGKPVPPPEVAAFIRARFVANAPASLAGMARLLTSAPDRVDELAAAGTSSLVVRGADDDAWAHPVQDDMAARLGTTVTVIADAAHSPAVENPDETARVLSAFFTTTR